MIGNEKQDMSFTINDRLSTQASIKCPVFGEKILKNAQIQISTHVHLSQLKLGANLKKKDKNFCDQVWKKFWKEFCDFCKTFTCLTLFVFIFLFLISSKPN